MTENEVGVILEEVRRQYQGTSEGISALLPMRQDVAVLKTDMAEVKTGIQIIKGVLRAHSHAINQMGSQSQT